MNRTVVAAVPQLLVLVFALLSSAPLSAQQIRGTITGVVRDPSSAPVPGVTISATNTQTNVVAEAATNGAGVFIIPQLQPGPYQIVARLAGFKTFTRHGIDLHTAETVTLEIELEVGSVEETFTVSGRAGEAETNRSMLLQTVDGAQISDLPLNGRQVYMLMPLTSGTLFTQTAFGATGFSGTRAWDVNGSMVIHGSRAGNNEYLIDGAPGSGTGGGTGAWNYAPPVDAVQEFVVQTASTDASYGRTSGGIVNLTLRSGGNQLRGSALALHRGTWLDANQIQNIRNRISKQGHEYYNSEAIVSGPIRRNRTFFMGGYQGFYEDIPFPATRTVPTEAQLRGDFSQTFTAQGQPIPVYDPATTTCNASGQCTRQPFPGNIVPEDRWHPISRALLQHIPRPNAIGTNTGAGNFINSPNLGRYRYNSYLTRVDHVFTDRQRLSVSNAGNWGLEYRNENALPEPATRSDNYPTHRNHYLLTADYAVLAGSQTSWNTRVSWDRFDEPHEKEYGGLDPELPFTGPFQLGGVPFPQVDIAGFEGMFPRNFRRVRNDAYSVSSSVSRNAGRHLFKIGGDFREYRFLRIDEVDANGAFTFGNEFTRRDPLSNSGAPSGNGFATFLLGLPTAGQVEAGTPRTERYRYFGIYAQDEWKLSRRATLNLGLRWDYQPPVTEVNGFTVSAFDAVSPNPLQSSLRTSLNPATGAPLNLQGGVLFANRGGPESPYEPDWNNLQPRAAFTFRVNDRMVARANYGRSYFGLSSSGQTGVYTTDFQRTTPFVAFAPNGIEPGAAWSDPFPEGFLQPLAGELGLATFLGQNLTVPNRDYNIPYSDQWMAGFDLELPWEIDVDVAYVRNRVNELGISRNINQVPQAERDKAITRLGGNPGYATRTFPNPFAGLLPGTARNGTLISGFDLARPYPQFGDITMNRLNEGRSFYDALEAVAIRRYSAGLMLAVNYTLMRMEDRNTLLNPYDPEPFRDLDGNMRRHNVTVRSIVDLPFGAGRRFGGDTTGLVRTLISGWQVNAIGEMRSGRPLAHTASAILLDPDGSAALGSGERSYDRWFDNSTASNPRPNGTFAWSTIGANDYRQIGLRFPDVTEPSEPQWSLSLFKTTRLGERLALQLRVETFNVFNVRIYPGPSTNPSSATFGVVDTTSQLNFARTTQIGVRLQF